MLALPISRIRGVLVRRLLRELSAFFCGSGISKSASFCENYAGPELTQYP
jgi:hypothetical protein